MVLSQQIANVHKHDVSVFYGRLRPSNIERACVCDQMFWCGHSIHYLCFHTKIYTPKSTLRVLLPNKLYTC